jgi:hypothetical protein
MTREEEIKQASIDYIGPVNECNPLPWVSFREGAKWADSHPRKGLVDIDKACEWLIENYPTNDGGELYIFIKDFQKAMEE